MNDLNQLSRLRAELDQLDEQLLDLLAQRFEIVELIGVYKREHSMAPLDASRWEEVLKTRLAWASGKGLSADMIREIFEAIHRAALEAEGNELPGK